MKCIIIGYNKESVNLIQNLSKLSQLKIILLSEKNDIIKDLKENSSLIIKHGDFNDTKFIGKYMNSSISAVIALSDKDIVNIFACHKAKSELGIINTICRTSHSTHQTKLNSENISFLFNAKEILAEHIINNINCPFQSDIIHFNGKNCVIISFKANRSIFNIAGLIDHVQGTFIALERNDQILYLSKIQSIESGDVVYLYIPKKNIKLIHTYLPSLKTKDELKKITLCGANAFSCEIINKIRTINEKVKIDVIDQSEQELSELFTSCPESNIRLIKGSFIEQETRKAAQVKSSNLIITNTNSCETDALNVLTASTLEDKNIFNFITNKSLAKLIEKYPQNININPQNEFSSIIITQLFKHFVKDIKFIIKQKYAIISINVTENNVEKINQQNFKNDENPYHLAFIERKSSNKKAQIIHVNDITEIKVRDTVSFMLKRKNLEKFFELFKVFS